MAFFTLEAPGLTIFPNHRLVARRARLLRHAAAGGRAPLVRRGGAVRSGCLRARARAAGGGGRVRGLHADAAARRRGLDRVPAGTSPAWRALAVSVLHEGVLRPLLDIDDATLDARTHVDYTADAGEAVRWAREGRYQAAFLIASTTPEELQAVVRGGEVLPQKSTHFYPKLLDGLVFQPAGGVKHGAAAQDRDGGRGDPERRRARGQAAGAQGGRGGGAGESIRREVRGRPHAADRRRRGIGRATGQEGHRGARRAGGVVRKAAIVGEGGEYEHAAALLHPSSARRCARPSAAARPSSRRPRNWAARHRHRRAAALQGRRLRAHALRRDGSPAARRAAPPTRSCWSSSSPTAAGRTRASAGSPRTRRRKRTGSARSPNVHQEDRMMARREFLKTAAAAGVVAMASPRAGAGQDQARRAGRAARRGRAELLRARRNLPVKKATRSCAHQPAGQGLRARRAHAGLAHARPHLVRLQSRGQEAVRDRIAAVRHAGAVAGSLRAGDRRRESPSRARHPARGADHPQGLPQADGLVSAFYEADSKTPTGSPLPEGPRLKKVYLVGLATDFCVAWSALDARKAGFDAAVIEDATRASMRVARWPRRGRT